MTYHMEYGEETLVVMIIVCFLTMDTQFFFKMYITFVSLTTFRYCCCINVFKMLFVVTPVSYSCARLNISKKNQFKNTIDSNSGFCLSGSSTLSSLQLHVLGSPPCPCGTLTVFHILLAYIYILFLKINLLKNRNPDVI